MGKFDSCKSEIKRNLNLEYIKKCMPASVQAANRALEYVIEENRTCRLKEEDPETNRKRKLVKKYKLDGTNLLASPKVTSNIPLVVSKDKFVNAIAILEKDDDEPPAKKDKASVVRASCRKHQRSKQEHGSWDTAAHVIRSIKHSVSIHDWDNLTHLLLLLAEHNQMYLPFVKEVSSIFIVIMHCLIGYGYIIVNY